MFGPHFDVHNEVININHITASNLIVLTMLTEFLPIIRDLGCYIMCCYMYSVFVIGIL